MWWIPRLRGSRSTPGPSGAPPGQDAEPVEPLAVGRTACGPLSCPVSAFESWALIFPTGAVTASQSGPVGFAAQVFRRPGHVEPRGGAGAAGARRGAGSRAHFFPESLPAAGGPARPSPPSAIQHPRLAGDGALCPLQTPARGWAGAPESPWGWPRSVVREVSETGKNRAPGGASCSPLRSDRCREPATSFK